MNKGSLKDLLAKVPWLPELYWRVVDGGGPTIHYAGRNTLDRLMAHLPEWGAAASESRERYAEGLDLHIFSTYRYWIENACLLGHALHGLGHQVSLSYLPYYKYQAPNNAFDLRRQNAYIKSALRGASPPLRVVPLMDQPGVTGKLPEELERRVEEISLLDAQYALREEDINREGEVYRLRLMRNRFAAERALGFLSREPPDTVIVPNGSILEFAVVYHVCRYLGLTVVTYEFDEPRERIRLALNDEVMREDTTQLWQAHEGVDLRPEQKEQIESLIQARRGGDAWGDFEVRFQDRPPQGQDRLRAALGLDSRPVVLIAPNVFGDSATLGRQVFSKGLSSWVERTVSHFLEKPEVQVVVRVHPSEAKLSYGSFIGQLISSRFPALPEHMTLVEAADPVNTYDLIEIADLGLVYTTTVGLEMSLSGVPVIVSGVTHYRGKGFTLDPHSWDEYFELIDQVVADPGAYRLTEKQVRAAWQYAYRFFFEFTLPFPWHLLYFWEDVDKWPLRRVLSPVEIDRFIPAFRALAGKPVNWKAEELRIHAG